MKKITIIIVLLIFSLQSTNAHMSTTAHTHDSFIIEYLWVLMPLIGLLVFAIIRIKNIKLNHFFT